MLAWGDLAAGWSCRGEAGICVVIYVLLTYGIFCGAIEHWNVLITLGIKAVIKIYWTR